MFVCPEHGELEATAREGEVTIYVCPECGLRIEAAPAGHRSKMEIDPMELQMGDVLADGSTVIGPPEEVIPGERVGVVVAEGRVSARHFDDGAKAVVVNRGPAVGGV